MCALLARSWNPTPLTPLLARTRTAKLEQAVAACSTALAAAGLPSWGVRLDCTALQQLSAAARLLCLGDPHAAPDASGDRANAGADVTRRGRYALALDALAALSESLAGEWTAHLQQQQRRQAHGEPACEAPSGPASEKLMAELQRCLLSPEMEEGAAHGAEPARSTRLLQWWQVRGLPLAAAS